MDINEYISELEEGYNYRVESEKIKEDKRCKKVGKLTSDQQKLVEDNLNLIHYTIRRKLSYVLKYIEYDDAFQQGALGLCYAAKYFNPDYGTKFSTYASAQIIGYIRRYYRNYASLIRIPRSLIDIKYRVMNYLSHNPDATNTELSEILDIPIEKINEVMTAGLVNSLDDTITEDSDNSLHELIGYEDNEISNIEVENLIIQITNFLSRKQSSRSKDIIEDWIYCSYYGSDPPSQVDLAEKYHVSQPQVSRIIIKFRKEFKEYLLKGDYL